MDLSEYSDELSLHTANTYHHHSRRGHHHSHHLMASIPGKTWSAGSRIGKKYRILTQQSDGESRSLKRVKLQSDHHHPNTNTGQMPFLLLNNVKAWDKVYNLSWHLI